MKAVWIALALAVATLSSVAAQEQESAPQRESRSPAAGLFQPTLDAGDLWHVLRHGRADPLAGDPGAATPTPGRNHFFVAAPTIASKPSTGLSVGLNSNLAFFSGDERTTHISSVSGGARFSQKKQVLSGIRFNIFTPDDHWFLQGDNRLSWTSQNTYGLGADTLALGTGTENVKFNAFKLYETGYRTVRAAPVRRGSASMSARTRTSVLVTVCSRPSTSRPTPPTTTATVSPTSDRRRLA